MPILLARIDDRLIHGQVTEGWGKRLKPDLIVVVSDNIVLSEWECDICMAALPSSIHGKVVSIEKAPDIVNHLHEARESAYVLFESPCDAWKTVSGGARLPEVNVGGMHSIRGKRRILDYVFVDETDVACLKALRDAGVKLDFRDLPDRESPDVMGQL
ncbi:MAG: PTS system mannose/fructose/N-acetylgalactosamine-transporter subunit IIB [Candidatus Latescibacterota bacterium]